MQLRYFCVAYRTSAVLRFLSGHTSIIAAVQGKCTSGSLQVRKKIHGIKYLMKFGCLRSKTAILYSTGSSRQPCLFSDWRTGHPYYKHLDWIRYWGGIACYEKNSILLYFVLALIPLPTIARLAQEIHISSSFFFSWLLDSIVSLPITVTGIFLWRSR